MVHKAIHFLLSSLIANMATILIHFLQKFALVRSFQHFAIKFLNQKIFLARLKSASKQRWSPQGRPCPRGHILKSLALASKPEVLGLGLEASSPRKLPCPQLENSTFFEQLKFRWKTPKTSRKICEHLFCFPQLEHRRRQGEGAHPPTIEISPITKM